MANAKFDYKSFNPEAFKYMVGRVPNLNLNELKKSRALSGNPDIRSVFSSQNGTAYARIAMRGLADGSVVNYDGSTNITASSTKTFEQGVVVVGRAKGWVERDFSYDITGGVDFMANIAQQVAEFWDKVDQDTLLAILEGIFKMSGVQNTIFKNQHTYDITSASPATVGATTLNSAINKACGDNKKKFSMVFCHSDVATGLENLNLIDYMKYTDANGVQRDLQIGTWNGKLVLVDDSMPTETTVDTQGVYTLTISTAATAGDKISIFGAEYEWVANGTDSTATNLVLPSTNNAANEGQVLYNKLSGLTSGEATKYTITRDGAVITFTQKTTAPGYHKPDVTVTKGDSGTFEVAVAQTTASVEGTKYTTYALGEGAFSYEDIGAKVPYEMDRNPAANGGEDTLYSRQRKVFAPYGISYEKVSQSSNSPTDAELKNGANWSLVHSGEASEDSRSFINHKAIPICRILSKG